jgi:signal transduction histidine kinase
VASISQRSSSTAGLKRLADRVLEAADLPALARLLTRALPELLDVSSATLLVWDRKLDAFEALTPGETQIHPVWPAAGPVQAPEARYMISDGRLIETRSAGGEGTLLPLMARAGLAGMLVLGPRRRAYRPGEVRLLSVLASRAALAVENGFYQRELIASERLAALGSMAGMLAHDMRGPMTVIRGYAETLLEGSPDEREVKERARIIVDMVDRLDRMTSETLDFARSGGRLSLVVTDIARMLAEWSHAVGQLLPGLVVLLEVRTPRGACAEFDPDKLGRALSNVAFNAYEAMHGCGRLHVEARLELGSAGAPASLVIDLRDEGPGVPKSIHDSLFEPFVTEGKTHGTGLGLAVTRRFVEDHGGSVELLPDGPGACFRLRLPVAPTAHAPRA